MIDGNIMVCNRFQNMQIPCWIIIIANQIHSLTGINNNISPILIIYLRENSILQDRMM